MTTSELERRVAVALKQHAEAAMSETKIDQAKLERLLTDAEGRRTKSRRAWIAGAVAAAAAVVGVIVWAMGPSSGKPNSSSPLPDNHSNLSKLPPHSSTPTGTTTGHG